MRDIVYLRGTNNLQRDPLSLEVEELQSPIALPFGGYTAKDSMVRLGKAGSMFRM